MILTTASKQASKQNKTNKQTKNQKNKTKTEQTTNIEKAKHDILFENINTVQDKLVPKLSILKRTQEGLERWLSGFRTLTALPEVPSSIPNNRLVAHNHL